MKARSRHSIAGNMETVRKADRCPSCVLDVFPLAFTDSWVSLRLHFQLDKELEEMSTRHKEVEDQAEREEAKAKKVMKNLRVLQGKEWDEQRATPGESLETLRLKVQQCTCHTCLRFVAP